MMGVLGWTLLALVAMDVGVSLLFPMPGDISHPPSQLAAYFDYGRSIESKLDRLVGPDDARSAPIVAAGWIERDCMTPPAKPAAGQIGVTVYGMSFSGRVAAQMTALDPRVTPTSYGGPAAPLSHSVACAEEVGRHGRDPNHVRVVGVLASSLGRLLTLGGLTTSFEAPTPFTYPRYHPSGNDGLSVEQPLVRSSDALRNPVALSAYFAQLSRDDAFYNAALFDRSIVDHSAVFRMLRRAYAQAEQRRLQARLVVGEGHALKPEVAAVLERLLLRFAADARRDGAVPIVLLLQDRGGDADLLFRSVGPLLDRNDIAVISSHRIASNANPANFLPDGHFTAAVDRALARQILAVVRPERPKP